MHTFDKPYWDEHWTPAASDDDRRLPTNPYVPAETASLTPGTALDAGCGTGAEALWLAAQGWQVTGADLSATALGAAARRADAAGLRGRVEWVETDLTTWEAGRTWDLVVTSYAHASIGQLALYQRLATWVAPGGTLLVVGHLPDDGHGHEHAHRRPHDATATPAGIAVLFTAPQWRIAASYTSTRIVQVGGREARLRDVVVRAHRTA